NSQIVTHTWKQCETCLFYFFITECATEHDSWNIAVSHSVVGLEGSCLDISCRFNYPGSDRKASDYKGIWLTDSNEKVFHSEASQISSTFLHRTSMLGDLHHRNCSLKINPLKNSDKGPFTFRIEIQGFNKYSFGNHKVTVTVKDAPERPTLHVEEEMKTRKKVTVTCSVLHSCPSAPPRITWNHPGKESIESKKQADDQWQLTSSLSFTTTNQDNNKVLSCTAEFTGGKKVSSSKILNVKCESCLHHMNSNDLKCKIKIAVTLVDWRKICISLLSSSTQRDHGLILLNHSNLENVFFT
uniref:Ig-like domain-containing protein n=1 Tax=Astyanax mexicanus TaxID=7994 RepID=A0A8B9GMU8_ASTMX